LIRACKDIIKILIENEDHEVNLDAIKRDICRKYNLKSVPANSLILSYAKENERDLVRPILLKKPTRSLSGVSVIAVMTSPFECPHGKCIYCPGGPELGSPQSYTGKEPAALRGYQNSYDPYLQVSNRIKQLKSIGHPVNKLELIIMGGTFPSRDWGYQKDFVKGCLEGIIGSKTNSLGQAKKLAETSEIRNVGITIETRPDYCKKDHVDKMLELGTTRVEIGVQVLSQKIYKLIKRGHTIEDVVEATRIAKDSGLKVCYHMMPGLPTMNVKKDFRTFLSLFNENKFKPDMLKIYPCLVLENTNLHKLWERGDYIPYTTEQLLDLLVKIMEILPPWVRIQRVQRDIPAYLISSGSRKSDLRELVLQKMDDLGIKTSEIRYREVGHQLQRYNREPSLNDIKLKLQSYDASEGEEIFISFEDNINDILIGFLRLRIPSEKADRTEIKDYQASLIRELHIFGPELEIGAKPIYQWQHRGYGNLLVKEAEYISKKVYDRKRILVTSGLGAKEYYRKLNYKPLGPYMVKSLK
jgi:elongator complex protein 3